MLDIAYEIGADKAFKDTFDKLARAYVGGNTFLPSLAKKVLAGSALVGGTSALIAANPHVGKKTPGRVSDWGRAGAYTGAGAALGATLGSSLGLRGMFLGGTLGALGGGYASQANRSPSAFEMATGRNW